MSSPRPEHASTVVRHDLDTAIALARQVRASGLAPAPLKQVALASDPDANPDTFMQKFYSAAKYGLVALHRERIGVTGQATTLPLLEALDDPAREHEARVTAFLNIPLHRAFAERYRDQPLPPGAEVQRILAVAFGVSAGQVANVRRVLLRSLRQAGLLGADGRLTTPRASDALHGERPTAQPQQTADAGGTVPPEDAAPRHADTIGPVIETSPPFIAIPLEQVPLTVRAWLTQMPPEGAAWPETQYEQWHAAFRALTDAIYRHG